MKKFVSLVLFVSIFNLLNAQSSYVVSVYGDTLVCDSVNGTTCVINGKVDKKFSAREISVAMSDGVFSIFKNGFNKGKVVMASDSVLITSYTHIEIRYTQGKMNQVKQVPSNHIYFVNRSNLKILHQYSSWYLDGAPMILKYFPKTDKCPAYNKAIDDFDAACKKGIRAPTIEGRALFKAWNNCFPFE